MRQLHVYTMGTALYAHSQTRWAIRYATIAVLPSIPLAMMRHFLLLPIFFSLVGASAARDVEEGKAAPPIEAQLLNGTRFMLANQTGKVVVINFWATWCPPCRQEMPTLETYYRMHRTEGLELLAISIDVPEDLAKVKEVMRAYSFPAALISEANAEGYGRIKRIPQTYVIDRQGVLRHDGLNGRAEIDLPFLEQTVTPLLERGRPAPILKTHSVRQPMPSSVVSIDSQ